MVMAIANRALSLFARFDESESLVGPENDGKVQ
jgi:hypothetical protein